jgi:hypothetical protein
MGFAKRQMEEAEELRSEAMRVLLHVGALEECEYHTGEYFEGSSDVEEAYKAANSRITADKIVLPHGTTRRDFTDIIKGVYDDNSNLSGCSACEKYLSD